MSIFAHRKPQDARTPLDYVKAELLAADNSIPRDRALLALFDSFVKTIEKGELEARISALEQANNKARFV
jgi:hypothetical protein